MTKLYSNNEVLAHKGLNWLATIRTVRRRYESF